MSVVCHSIFQSMPCQVTSLHSVAVAQCPKEPFSSPLSLWEVKRVRLLRPGGQRWEGSGDPKLRAPYQHIDGNIAICCSPSNDTRHAAIFASRDPALQRQQTPTWLLAWKTFERRLGGAGRMPGRHRFWLVVSTPLKNMKVRLDHHPQSGWGKIKLFQTTNQDL